MSGIGDITRICQSLGGDPTAADELLPLVYNDLRKLAASKFARELPGQTLQATALVHEAWLRVTGGNSQQWQGRRHFFAAAAEAMRRILIEQARRKRAHRHGGDQKRANIEDLDIAAPDNDDRLLAVHEALDRLTVHDPTKAEVVKLHYFVGLTLEETANALEVSTPTVKRYWAYARAWLYRDLQTGADPFSPESSH